VTGSPTILVDRSKAGHFLSDRSSLWQGRSFKSSSLPQRVLYWAFGGLERLDGKLS
jgi:hypothetical protein